MHSIWQDARYAIRTLLKVPAFTAVALLILVLGIGANATMFSITNGVLLRPLPYPGSDRLLFWTFEDPARGIVGLNVSFTRLSFVQQGTQTLESIGAAFIPWTSSVALHGEPQQVPSAIVSQSLFAVFGVSPALGRGFSPEEDRAGGASVAVISDAFWHDHLGGAPDVLGQTMRVDGRDVQIIGVLSPGFRFPFVAPEPQIWLPRVFENPLFPPDRVQSGAAFLNVFARMRPGVTIEQAQAELRMLDAAYAKTYPGFSDALNSSSRLTDLKDSLVGPVRISVLVLFAAVGAVLLMGCVNLAGLLLARATTRTREIAIRRALGASFARILRQVLTETILLSFAGGVLGLLLAFNAPRLLQRLPAGSLPRLNEVTFDARVILFSFAVALVTGILFGLLPALQNSGGDSYAALKEGTRGIFGGRHATRSRGLLVIGEVALAVMLVSGAGLLLKSFTSLQRVNPGFDPNHVMTFSIALPTARYPTRPQQSDFYRRLVEAVEARPQVQSAGVTTYLPIGGGIRLMYFCAEGTVCQGIGKDPVAARKGISPDYIKAMRVPLLRGRVFNDHDNAGSRPVCLINDDLASKFFPGQDPIGKHVLQIRENISVEIVGVVATVKYAGLSAAAGPELYQPHEQSRVPVSNMSLVVRSDAAPEAIVASVRAEMAKLDTEVPLSAISSMNEVISVSVAQPRLTARITALFGALALFLAAIGVYGLMAFSVAQRKHEMAVRIALGATSRDILRLSARTGLSLVLAGAALGLLGTFALTRLIAAILFQTSARDPLTLAISVTLLVTVAVLACYFPARRASRTDPVEALRSL